MKNNLFKKSIAIVMTVMMLMTCWVFMPATHEHLEAEAALAYGMSAATEADSKTGYVKFHPKDSVDYVNMYYPSDIYIDVSEDLTSAGYKVYLDGHYGDSDKYRTLVYSTAWGGSYDRDNGVLKDKTMLNTFNNYTYSASGTNVYSAKENYSVDGTNWVINFQGASTNFSATVNLEGGTPKVAAGEYHFDADNSKSGTTSHARVCDMDKKNTWGNWGKNVSSTYIGNSNYTGDINIYIHVYDKAPLQTAITDANSYLAKTAQYDRASLANLKSKVDDANDILKTRNVTQAQVKAAKDAITTAINGLVARTYEVTYENLFSLSDWYNSDSSKSSDSNVKTDLSKGTIAITNSSGDEYTTTSSTGDYSSNRYAIDLVGGNNYYFMYDTSNNTKATEVFMMYKTADGKAISFESKHFSGDNKNNLWEFTAPANAAKAEIRFDNNTQGSTATFSNIAIYKKSDADKVGIKDWTTRPAGKSYTYGSALGATLDVPVRTGATFNGWYLDTNSNGLHDAGETFTDGNGKVVDGIVSFKIAQNYVLRSDWTINDYDIGYDNLFSLAEWENTNSNKVNDHATNLEVDLEAGTIAVTGMTDAYTIYGGGSDQYTVPVTAGETYIFDYDVTSTNGTYQAFVFFYNANGEGVTGAIYNGSAQTNAHIGVYNAQPITFTVPEGCTKIGIRVGLCGTEEGTATYSNIGIYEKEVYDAYAKDYTRVREAFRYGDVKEFYGPTREGYVFDGWELADGTKITSTEGLSASTTIYASWIKRYTVTFYYGDNTSVLDEIEVNDGTALGSLLPQSTPTKASTAEYEYEFDYWYANGDTFDENTVITSDLRVYPVFNNKSHGDFGFELETGSTCEANAMVKKTCGQCNYYFGIVEYNPAEDADAENNTVWLAKGHSYTGGVIQGTDDDDVHYKKCARYNTCGSTIEEAHSWDGNTSQGATCVTPGTIKKTCSACYAEKFVDGDTDPNTHVNTRTINAKTADCENDGYTGDTYCDDCNKTIKTGTATPKLGHLDENKDHICDRGCGIAQGTCSDSATDGDHKCDYGCGKVLEDCSDKANDGDHKCDICDEDNVTAHIKGSETKENITEATCGNAGKYDSVYYCTECNTEMERTNDVTIAQKPHNWQAATYSWTADGKICTATRTCANNAAHTESETVNATGVQTVAPTCEEKGATLYTADFEADWAVTQTNTVYDIPAKNHTPAEAVIENNTPATCTKDGSYDTVIYCSVEGCKKQISRVTTTVTATGHTAGAVVVENEVDATCTTGGSYDNVTYCTVCGEETSRETITVPQKGHTAGAVVVENNVPATCTTDGSYDNVTYCTVCGTQTSRETIAVPQKGHTAGAIVVENNVPETCTTDGSYDNVTYCTVCGIETSRETIVVPQKGHTAGAEATCTEDQTCTVCGEVLVAALEHDYEVVVTKPTCTTDGYTTYTCTRGDHTYTADTVTAPGHTAGAEATCTTAQTCTVCNEVLVGALGHKAGADATCTEDQTCTVCGEVLVEAPGHTAGADATCTTAQTCTVCGEVLVGALGHKAGADATCTEDQICTVCGEVLVEALGHKAGADATCTEDQTCTVCGEVLVGALGHTAGADATCTENQTCTVCGEVLVEALGHTAGADATCTTAQTCTVCGEVLVGALGHKAGADATCTEDQTCTVCGEVLVDALGHKAGADATCTEDQTCTVCGEVLVEASGHTAGADATCTENQTCTVCGEVLVEALGHTAGADATCTTAQTCTVCGEELKAALQHDYKAVVTDPTCTEDGYTTHTCTKCGDTYTDNTVVALGHTWVAATCTTPKTCSVCGETEGKANGHNMTDYGYTVPSKVELPEGTVIAEPTCKKDGLAISYCENEGCTHYDTMVAARDKDAHNWGEEIKGEGNCTTGVTFYTECSYCGTKTVTKVEVVPHELVLVAYEPANCTTEEILYYMCSVCGYDEEIHGAEDNEYDVALGHDWAKDVIEKEATCGQTGRKYSICSRCNAASEKVEIPRLGHVWETEGFNYAEYMAEHPNANILYVEASDATCTYEGYNGYYKCFSCSYDQHLDNEWRKDNVIAVKAHEDKDRDNKCDECNAKLYGDDSNSACGCICHKENWFSKLIYKILCFFWKLFGIGKSCECGTVHY